MTKGRPGLSAVISILTKTVDDFYGWQFIWNVTNHRRNTTTCCGLV